MTEKVAVVVAHPDDEVLAFGGSICRHTERGDSVSILILATGLAARADDGSMPPKELKSLRQDARNAGELMGVKDIRFCDFPDNRMDSVALLDVIKVISRTLEETQATTVYTHHIGDLNVDHEIVARAVLTACRPVPNSRVRCIYAGEVLSSSEYSLSDRRFVPNTYVRIDHYLERKCNALLCYHSEQREWPHPRSVEAIRHLAGLRGSECGVPAAEGLLLMRKVLLELHSSPQS